MSYGLPITVRISTAWEASGLSAEAFADLLGGLRMSGLAAVSGGSVTFRTLRVAQLVMGRRTAKKRRRP